MSKQPIPVYDICSLADAGIRENDFLAESFGRYLKRHSPGLHLPHRHDFYHLVLFSRGSGTHTIDFTQFKVRPYEMYFMIPGQVHSWQFEGETDGYIVHFSDGFFRSFLLNPNYLERFRFFDGISEDCVCRIPVHIQPPLQKLFEEILVTASDRREPDLIRLLLLRLFMLVAGSQQKTGKLSAPHTNHVLLRNFRKLIDQHYMSIRLPKEYAELLYVTPNHLNALSKDLLRKSAGELIRDRILLETKRLLTNAGLTITEIAFSLNFQDNSYFNRFFKKYTGITPDEFRKKLFIPKMKENDDATKSKK